LELLPDNLEVFGPKGDIALCFSGVGSLTQLHVLEGRITLRPAAFILFFSGVLGTVPTRPSVL